MNNSSSNSHRSVQHSTTLNRKYVKRPVVSSAPKIDSVAKRRAENLKRRQALAEQINRERLAKMKAKTLATAKNSAKVVPDEENAIKKAALHPVESVARKRLALRKTVSEKPSTPSISMKEKKDQAIESAMKSVATMEKKGTTAPKMKNRSFFSFKRVALAFGCAALAVAAIAYFINLSMPDISVRVTAMQTGIDASYPSYIPRDYSLSSIVSEEGKVSMTFSTASGDSFTLTEEKSSWDSSALESNYVKDNFADYTPIREQGLTLFVSGSDCAWVNGGKVFVIKTTSGSLTKKQLKSIAVSL